MHISLICDISVCVFFFFLTCCIIIICPHTYWDVWICSVLPEACFPPGKAPCKPPAPPPQHEASPGKCCQSLPWEAELWEEGEDPLRQKPASKPWTGSEWSEEGREEVFRLIQ